MDTISQPLDKLDFAILIELQKDGRKSFTDIAHTLKISVGTVRNRYNLLIKNHTLTIIGRVDPGKVGFLAYAHIFIKVRPITEFESVAAKIARLPEVSFLAMTTGQYDLEVNVQCRDNDHLIKLMNERIHKTKGVFETQTNMYLRVFKIAQPDLNLIKSKS